MMKVHGFEVPKELIRKAEAVLRKQSTVTSHSHLRHALEFLGVEREKKVKGTWRFISYDLASRLLKFWKEQGKIKKHNDNRGGYWEWIKQ